MVSMASENGNPVSLVSEQVESSTDSSMEDEDWNDEELETLTRAVAKLTYAMASWFDEERATEMIQDMRRIEANVASLIAEGKSVEIPTRSQEIDDAPVDGSSTPSMDPSDLPKSDKLTESMEDDEENLPLQALEESPKLIIDNLVDPALSKELPSLIDHQVLDELSAPAESMEIVVSKGIKDNIPLQSLLPRNSSLDRVMLYIHELGNGQVGAIICDELLCFDPGGLCLMIDSYGVLEGLPKPRDHGPIVAKESLSKAAHQVLDKMSAPMERTNKGEEYSRVENRIEVTPIRDVLFDLFELQRVFDLGIAEKWIEIVVSNPNESIDIPKKKLLLMRATYLDDLGSPLCAVIIGRFTSTEANDSAQLSFDPGGNKFVLGNHVSIESRETLYLCVSKKTLLFSLHVVMSDANSRVQEYDYKLRFGGCCVHHFAQDNPSAELPELPFDPGGGLLPKSLFILVCQSVVPRAFDVGLLSSDCVRRFMFDHGIRYKGSGPLRFDFLGTENVTELLADQDILYTSKSESDQVVLILDPGSDLFMLTMADHVVYLMKLRGSHYDFSIPLLVARTRGLTSTEAKSSIHVQASSNDSTCAAVDPLVLLTYVSNGSKYDVVKHLNWMGKLLTAGFKYSVLFGTTVRLLADKQGRRRECVELITFDPGGNGLVVVDLESVTKRMQVCRELGTSLMEQIENRYVHQFAQFSPPIEVQEGWFTYDFYAFNYRRWKSNWGEWRWQTEVERSFFVDMLVTYHILLAYTFQQVMGRALVLSMKLPWRKQGVLEFHTSKAKIDGYPNVLLLQANHKGVMNKSFSNSATIYIFDHGGNQVKRHWQMIAGPLYQTSMLYTAKVSPKCVHFNNAIEVEMGKLISQSLLVHGHYLWYLQALGLVLTLAINATRFVFDPGGQRLNLASGFYHRLLMLADHISANP